MSGRPISSSGNLFYIKISGLYMMTQCSVGKDIYSLEPMKNILSQKINIQEVWDKLLIYLYRNIFKWEMNNGLIGMG